MSKISNEEAELRARYPALARFVGDYVENRIEADNLELFELCLVLAGQWTQEPSATNVWLENVAYELAKLANDLAFTPDQLAALFMGDAATPLIVPECARADLAWLGRHLLFLLTYPLGVERSQWPRVLAALRGEEAPLDAFDALAAIHSLMATPDAPERLSVVSSLLGARRRGELGPVPWCHEGNAVWSERNHAAMARAIGSYAYKVYLNAPLQGSSRLHFDDVLLEELDEAALEATLQAVHQFRFRHSAAPASGPDASAALYADLMQRIATAQTRSGRSAAAQKLLASLTLSTAQPSSSRARDAIQRALSFMSSTKEPVSDADVTRWLAPYRPNPQALKELRQLAHKQRKA